MVVSEPLCPIGLAGLTVAGMTIASGWRHIERPILIWLSGATLLSISVGLALVKSFVETF